MKPSYLLLQNLFLACIANALKLNSCDISLENSRKRIGSTIQASPLSCKKVLPLLVHSSKDDPKINRRNFIGKHRFENLNKYVKDICNAKTIYNLFLDDKRLQIYERPDKFGFSSV